MKRLNLAAAAFAGLLLVGCGYHTLGHSAALPAATRVVAVLPFANHTRQPQLSQALSAAVAQEFLQRTHYQVQPAAAGSDVEVHGDLLQVQFTPVTFDATSGRATTVEVVIHLQAWVTATATDRELFRNNDLVFHEQYQISNQQQTFFEEDTTAFLRLSHSAAQTLVADILEAF